MVSGLDALPRCENDGAKFHLRRNWLALLRPALAVSADPCDHSELPDAHAAIGIEEGAVVAERDAAVGSAAGAEHVGVSEQATAAVNRVLAADRVEPERRHAVEQRLPRRQFVDVWRRHAAHADARGMGIVLIGAQAGMRLE